MWLWGLLFVLAALVILFRMWGAAGRRRVPAGRGDQRLAPGREDDGPGHPAVIGPDQTNVNPPESYVIHHEGKGQGMDIANRALKERTEKLTADAPGAAGVPAKIPGRAPVFEEEIVAGATGDAADGARGPLRTAAADTHMEAAAELAYPYKAAPFTGTNKDRVRYGDSPREELRNRVIDIAAKLRTGPAPSHPGRGGEDPGRHPEQDGEADDPDHWAPLRETGALPERYGVDEVVALPTGPRRGYVYWELGGGAEQRLPPAVLARSRRALRVYDLTCGGAVCAQHPVGDGDDHGWLELPHDGHAYAVEVGRQGPGGEWYALARSAPLQAPLPPAPAAGLAGARQSPGWSPGARR